MLFSTAKTFKKLRTICLRDLEPQSCPTADGVVLPLTISAEGFRLHAFQTEGVDCNQETVNLSFYNLPSTGTAGVVSDETLVSASDSLEERMHLSQTILKVGTKILIKDPWLKHQMDGTVGIRVETPANVAFAHQELCHTCGVLETKQRKKLLRCGKCAAVYYCSVACQRQDWKSHKRDCAYEVENKEKHETTPDTFTYEGFSTIPVDTKMLLSGLRSDAALNGLECVVLRPSDNNQRYVVRTESGREFQVKPENLKALRSEEQSLCVYRAQLHESRGFY
jgi:hypothetical protein